MVVEIITGTSLMFLIGGSVTPLTLPLFDSSTKDLELEFEFVLECEDACRLERFFGD